MLEAQAEIDGGEASKAKAKKTAAKIQADAPIKFMQLSRGHELSAAGDIFEMGLNQALGTAKKEGGADFSSSKLNKVGDITEAWNQLLNAYYSRFYPYWLIN